MSRTVNPQVALYLTQDKVDLIREIARREKRTQQDLLREGVDYIIAKYPSERRKPKKRKS